MGREISRVTRTAITIAAARASSSSSRPVRRERAAIASISVSGCETRSATLAPSRVAGAAT